MWRVPHAPVVPPSAGEPNSSAGRVLLDPPPQCVPRQTARMPCALAAGIEQHDRGHGSDAVPRRQSRLRIDIDPAEVGARLKFLRQGGEARCHGAIRPAPRSPEVDRELQVRRSDMPPKRPSLRSIQRQPVQAVAARTRNDDHPVNRHHRARRSAGSTDDVTGVMAHQA